MPANLRPSTLPAFLCSLRPALTHARWAPRDKVDAQILVEWKVVERLLPVYESQALTHLRLTGLLRTALLVNFNVPVLRLRPATAHEETPHLHGPSRGGESSGVQEGGECGRPEVGRHRDCSGMDRVSPLSGSATRARRSRLDQRSPAPGSPIRTLPRRSGSPERLLPEMRRIIRLRGEGQTFGGDAGFGARASLTRPASLPPAPARATPRPGP